ncbi:hypothetical protein AAFF_G00369920 [Aldrovandia affinis]|uniref:THD domain-containing protein n=1 Tax=Aldrovandia affinis TaxID=143900 RepID=A0AAD7VYI1_9TELE|nr:hypothetical protein AAFF_G00369920 [Aldrovandia affinis]
MWKTCDCIFFRKELQRGSQGRGQWSAQVARTGTRHHCVCELTEQHWGWTTQRLRTLDAHGGTPEKQLGEQGESNVELSSKGTVTQTTERSSKEKKSRKASAHLTDLSEPMAVDGMLKWGLNGDAFVEGMEYQAGCLQVRSEGFYFIYSKVSFADSACSLFKHTVMRRTPRYYGDMELMKSKRFSCRDARQPEESVLNSYMGGVFRLQRGDSVFVKVENHTMLTQDRQLLRNVPYITQKRTWNVCVPVSMCVKIQTMRSV